MPSCLFRYETLQQNGGNAIVNIALRSIINGHCNRVFPSSLTTMIVRKKRPGSSVDLKKDGN